MIRALLATLVLLAGCGLREGYAFLVGVEELEPQELHARLSGPTPPFVVDVRGDDAYRAGHIVGAVPLGLGEIEGYFTRLGPPRDRPVVVVCQGGFRSVEGAARVSALGYLEVYSLAGGTSAWRERGYATVRDRPWRPPPELLRAPHLPMTGFQQLVGVFAGFTIKPAYVLLALALALLLWRKRERELVLIRWSLVAFALGEAACFVNSWLGLGLDRLWDGLHHAGMLAMGFLLAWGVWMFLDQRVLRLSADDASCVVRRLCGRCWKQDDGSCPVQRLLLFLIPAVGALAALPLTAPLRPLRIGMTYYGTDWPYSMTLDKLILQFRIYPVLAVLLSLVALALVATGRRGLRRAMPVFFAGLGLLTFSLFRFFLYETYRDMHVWADFWEEATEFLATFGVGVFLVVFRRALGLFGHPDPSTRPDPSRP